MSQAGLNVHVAREDLEILRLLFPPSKCRDDRHTLPYPVYMVLGIEPRVSCVLGKPSIMWI